MPCKVRGCRFAHSHASVYHRCGTCGVTGHGQIECGDAHKIGSLRQYSNDSFEGEPCQIRGCALRRTHCTNAHHCAECHRLGGGNCEFCVLVDGTFTVSCPVCRTVQAFERVYVTGSCPVCLEADSDCLYLGTQCRHAVCYSCGAAIQVRQG